MKHLLSLIMLLCFTSVSASEDWDVNLAVDTSLYPSYSLVTETNIPPLDRIDVAQRLQGVTFNSPINSDEIEREIGDIEIFVITSIQGGGIANVPTRLAIISDNIYVWVEEGLPYDDSQMSLIALRLESEVYQFTRRLWGSEPIPGIDGESRLHIVITQRLQVGLAGYFSANNLYPTEVSPTSNAREMIVLNSRILLPRFEDFGVSTAAHEFLHLIHNSNDLNEANWLNEGLATLTEHLLALDKADFFLEEYLTYPETSLRLFGLGNHRLAEYGASMSFMIYLYDRFGLESIQDIMADPDNGLASINNMLLSHDEVDVDVIFADWVLANLLRDTNSIYGYQSLELESSLNLSATVLNYPSTYTRQLDQYGSHYYRYENLNDSVMVSLDMSDTVSLIPIIPNDEFGIWYSLREDNSNPRLTRAFDLRDITTAQLDFNIWYDLEQEWDYGYISISNDGGQTWQLQSTSWMTSANSNGRAYGNGYTGGSDIWLEDSISLDDFVGQEILVRFEMVTDDAINFNGTALNDIRIDAVGYHSDEDAETWTAEGWIQTDNRLPQRAWVQVTEHNANGEAIIHRFLAQGSQEWQLDLADSTDYIHVVISPFAPMTSQMFTYTLQVQ